VVAMWPFVKLLWPLVVIMLQRYFGACIISSMHCATEAVPS